MSKRLQILWCSGLSALIPPAAADNSPSIATMLEEDGYQIAEDPIFWLMPVGHEPFHAGIYSRDRINGHNPGKTLKTKRDIAIKMMPSKRHPQDHLFWEGLRSSRYSMLLPPPQYLPTFSEIIKKLTSIERTPAPNVIPFSGAGMFCMKLGIFMAILPIMSKMARFISFPFTAQQSLPLEFVEGLPSI